MKILLALRPCSPGLAQRLAADDALARALGAKPHPAIGFLFPRFFDASGPVLPKLLALAEGEPVSFLRDVQCTAVELDGCSHAGSRPGASPWREHRRGPSGPLGALSRRPRNSPIDDGTGTARSS